MKNKRVGVIGAGSWGTAIAGVLSKKGLKTTLWGHRNNHIANLQNDRKNIKYLPQLSFNDTLQPTADLKEAVKGCDVICMVVPSQQYREVFVQILPYLSGNTVVVSAAKGIENITLQTMSQIMAEEIGKSGLSNPKAPELAVLSGPSFAQEVADEQPTAVTVGCRDMDSLKMLQNIFAADYFRVYASNDLTGLEISGAFKNIIAIATGICDGLGYGLNTRAALITRGLAEITRLGMHLGADPSTFSGLSGMGDLILTCTGDLSRNRTVGIKLGQGKQLKEILDEMSMVAEGVKTTLSGYRLAKKHHIEMPILEQVYNILYNDKDCSAAVYDLLAREMKSE